jgi:transcriptional regulator with XRE-family HTH domain
MSASLVYQPMFVHLRAWRRASSLTLHEVARRLGATHTTLLRYEKGELTVSAEVIRLLAEIYGCTPAELEVDPGERERGKRIHDAIELAKSLPPDLNERWLEIGRLLLGAREKDGS